ncbi:hypothetical protein DXT88_05885 [Herbaspirillum lusitanum]|uniref:VPA1262 family protein n=1 Tax=Herbaspirillum lusitanum TaxID=213312 RepID=UPI00223817B6|nr:VPA1262 family protein [Herbaspirillum lusitanum]MCW5297702.1 hypothetical protein [Herbaspirillum lusitanum]
MWNDTYKTAVAPILEDLLNDERLARLFSAAPRHCALQLWILRIDSGQSLENRVIYGRLLPYSHSSDRWFSSDDNKFLRFGAIKAEVARLNLYVKSAHCADLLRKLTAGRSISEVSKEMKLELSNDLVTRFGSTVLPSNDLIYRPVAYLINGDAYHLNSPSSPHGGAGAFSASITQTNKRTLFDLEQGHDIALAKAIVKRLNADTGLEFNGADTTRFGDLELLVFPALDDRERRLLEVNWLTLPHALVARFNPLQVPHFGAFQFRLCIENDGQVVYSAFSIAERDAEGVFECRFELSDQLHARTDTTELEIFGLQNGNSRGGTLCCRWRINYVREIHFQGYAVGQGASPVKFDWLEKGARSSASTRLKTALTIKRDNHGFASRVGGRGVDSWVPVNRDLLSLFSRFHPPKSEGQFFLRRSQGDGEGRLQFVEWFRALLAKYPQQQIVIFDPYFDTAGLGLLFLYAQSDADYVVFTSLPKLSKEESVSQETSDKPTPERINNLVAGCERNGHLLRRGKLRIFGLREGRLHDRYILIVGEDALPVAGFNLSNSFQTVAENHPLLVTPIPADVLLKVEQYQSGLIEEAESKQSQGQAENAAMKLLFDSTKLSVTPRRFEPLRFLEEAHAGNVLSMWTGELSLQGLSGNLLKEQLAALGMIEENSITLPEAAGLFNCIHRQSGDFSDFSATWEILGEVLAHSRDGDSGLSRIESEGIFLEFLAQFLEASFGRLHDTLGGDIFVTGAEFFRMPIERLLHSSYHPHHISHTTKYAGLSWSEYYAVKLLWLFSPNILVEIVEAKIIDVPMEPQGSDAVRLLMLSQIVSQIARTVQFGVTDYQRDRLLRSSSGLLTWMGLIAVEMRLAMPGGLEEVRRIVAAFSDDEQVKALGWMINRAAKDQGNVEIYKALVEALQDALPKVIPAQGLKNLVDSMRGHMTRLSWAEPWMFQDVISPLLQNERVKTDDASEIWIQELAIFLEPEVKTQSLLFELEREGETTNIAAFLFARSSSARQLVSLELLREILKKQRKIIQQPLASTSDWSLWDRALTVSMWLLAFARWSQYYLRGSGRSFPELDAFAFDVHELAMVKPIDEWRSAHVGEEGGLATFLDHAEKLLASMGEGEIL